MKRGVAGPVLGKLIILLVFIISAVLLALFMYGQPDRLTEFLGIDDNIACEQSACIKPPKIKIDFVLDGDDILLDASSTESCIGETVIYNWEINGNIYTAGDAICEDDICSQISCCELPSGFYFMDEDIYLSAEGNCSLLESRKKINVREDSGLYG